MKHNVELSDDITLEVETTQTPHGVIVTSFSLTAGPDTHSGVTTKTLKSINAQHLRPLPNKNLILQELLKSPLPSPSFLSTRRRSSISDEELSSIAHVYTTALQNNLHPTKVVVMWLGLSRVTVCRYIKMARERGIIPR